ncbi:MAG TPA: DUF1684 domain-containing protein [Candidatus Polarisedimenticolaceae bacterium]|nr:DUF1684 domain-containing protein [Candidatus Polarisedimenticolaceae bacterium]
MGRPWAAVSGLVLAGLFGACGEPSTGMMVSIPPPDGWREQLEGSRSDKDEFFKTDPGSPLLPAETAAFDGLDYWEPNADYYHVGRVNLYLEPQKFDVVTTSGVIRPCAKVGWVGFRQGGQDHKLQVYRLLDQAPQQGGADYFLPFMDETTGEETYPAGRYVDLVGPEGGPYVLDFNTASNPWCAYGDVDRFVCPVTPPENRLPVRIEAGERGYRQSPRAEDGAG